ncbi:MAG: CYTH domain-containing protein [Bacteroidota bacterium]|nr:CYTH domain-containing protein [Bacteroidota bacterium]
MKEIERKFLVNNAFKSFAVNQYRITQGYLNTDPHRTVRVRQTESKGFITIKGISENNGISREEFETEIKYSDAEKLLELSVGALVIKTRYIVPAGHLKFEVDVFEKENHGLVLAEIELTKENEHFKKPHWLGKEITGINHFYNLQLSQNPYCDWTEDLKAQFRVRH